MARTSQHRDAIVQTSVRLFRKQGFAGTGLNQIVQDSGAPKGSLYHYFPGGKDTIGAAAVAWAGQRVEHTLMKLAQDVDEPADIIRRYAQLLAGWIEQSGYQDGCPIATILLEMAPEAEAIRLAGEAALADWAAVFSRALEANQVPAPRAKRLASMAIAAVEGALLQARVAVQQRPLLDVAEEIALAFDAAIRDAQSAADSASSAGQVQHAEAGAKPEQAFPSEADAVPASKKRPPQTRSIAVRSGSKRS